MTAATGGRKLNNPANVCCAAKARALPPRTTWTRGLPFPPDIMSDEPDLIPATCPTSSCSSTPARGSSHASELTRHCDLFYLISFNCSDTLSFYISLSVCIFSLGEDTAAAAAAAGGIGDTTTRLIFNLKPSDPDSGNECFRNLFAVLEHNVQFKVVHSVGGSIQILYL